MARLLIALGMALCTTSWVLVSALDHDAGQATWGIYVTGLVLLGVAGARAGGHR